jgi:uncharacterized protein (TIGR00251 family)
MNPEERPRGSSARVVIRVTPGAPRTEIVGAYGEGWKVRVSAPAERGRANGAVISLLAEELGVARPSVRIVTGETSREKLIEIEGMTQEEAARRLSVTRRRGMR